MVMRQRHGLDYVTVNEAVMVMTPSTLEEYR